MKFENIVKSISSTLAAIMVYLIAAGMYLSFKGFVFENGEITLATPAQAQEIVESAVMDANGMRSSAVEYTDQLLGYVQNVIESAISTYSANYETLINDLKQYQEIIISNRQELVQTPETSEDDLLEYDNNSSSDDGLANLDLI